MADLRRRLALLTTLYFCQGLPGGFLAEALPAIALQQGVALRKVGLFAFVGLPWLVKLAWAPLVDRYGSDRFGRRKSWMVPALLGMIACTTLVGFADPTTELAWIVTMFFALNVCAATQDIAVDGFTVSLMHGRELAPANAAQVGGFKLGNLCGGGVLLMSIGVLGWNSAFAIMTGIMAIALLAVLAAREPAAQGAPQTWAIARAALGGLGRAPVYAAFLFLAKLAETIGGVLITPSMVRHGFDLPLLGLIDGTFGSIATVIGAVAGGVLARRFGWARTVLVLSCVQGVALCVTAFYQAGLVDPIGFGLLRAWEKLAGGGVAVAIFMLAMSKCTPAAASTQFTAAQTLYMSGGLVAGASAPALADAVGIGPVMLFGGGATIGLGILAMRWRTRIDAATADPASDSRSA